MGRTDCTEFQFLYMGDLYLFCTVTMVLNTLNSCSCLTDNIHKLPTLNSLTTFMVYREIIAVYLFKAYWLRDAPTV